jgi:hypothetical protein
MAKMARPMTCEERDAAATATYEVAGVMPIRDAVTRESVQPGGTVRLDPTRTNIDALIEAGSLKPLPAKAEKGKG